MPNKVAKAYAIGNAKISFVSLVDKAANKKQFLITKAADGSANFQSFGRIVKADADSHFVTGIVYEPMVEDTQGNFMTEDEIVKAAHWFMKNDGSVDVQHCFEKAESCEVVESFVAKSDMEIEGKAIKKGTWLMTMEVTDDDVWDSIQKGDITGFSMGGIGTYSEEDVILPDSDIVKSEEPKGILKKLAKALGMEVVEKGAMKANFVRRVKEDNFYSAWYALRSTLEGNYYNPDTSSWEWGYNADETTITDALTDFNDIVTQLLTSNGSIIKSLEKAAKDKPAPVIKAGKSLSTKNLETLQGISTSLSEFLSAFSLDMENMTKAENKNKVKNKKEEDEMNNEEVQKLVGEEVAKAMAPVTEQLNAIAKSVGGEEATQGGEPAGVTFEGVAKMVSEEVAKAMEPVTKVLEPLMKSRALPGNLNADTGKDTVTKSEPHFMAGMF